ncbi:PilZ domain-containing protein [Paenibacillus silvisoli]|uniref:PilZ domain-containing protein n=1 Tax=Paenibacillus silvisoli TaxID=3110539 RepID=UPI0028048D2D|nr:PilZ domain-containing protein [Paenibacillus silvisoli]
MSGEWKERGHIRIRLRDGVGAEMSICQVQGEPGEPEEMSKSSPILLQNMSPGGLQFLSHLRLPVSDGYMLQFSITLGEWQFGLLGHVVWRRKEDNHYIYGCELLPDDSIRKSIVCALLAKLQTMSPKQQRIHELYRRMTYRKETSYARLDVRG